MVTESQYEEAQAQLAEYKSRKQGLMKFALSTLPTEMTLADRNLLMDAMHDGLSDAYADLERSCNDIIESYERNDYRAMVRELSTVGA